LLLVGVGIVIALTAAGVVATAIGSKGEGSPTATAGTAVDANPDVDAGSAAGDVPAPGFALLDQRARTTSLAQFRGKVILLAFVDSQCTTICPLTTQSMLEALKLLGPASRQVQLLGVNANPLVTRVADVAAYTRAHDMQGRWRFLTGSRDQLAQVWRAYHVYVAAIHNNIDHEPIVYLIDGRGREQTIYLTKMSYEGVAQQAQLLANAVAGLLPGHPAVRQLVSLRYVPTLKPSETVRLTNLGRGAPTVVLGPGQPHLLVFFATWLRESSNLAASLAVLDRYTAVAKRAGWPAPVAVDELPSETSPAAAQRQLVRLGEKLDFPIVEDVSGRLADGYGVLDQPWYALTSSSGRIVWRHDGWLPLTDLTRHVQAALSRG
jgi:cytochrome oxidase Cu insertion factor (SCO1/SenC/PrrC family)